MLDLSKKYKRSDFINFLRNFLPGDTSFESKEINISTEFNSFRSAWIIGKSKSLENLSILEVEQTNSEKKRVQNTRDLFKLNRKKEGINYWKIAFKKNNQNKLLEKKIQKKDYFEN